MIRIEIEQTAPTGLRTAEVSWAAVPRIGDSVDMQQEPLRTDEDVRLDLPHGTVRSVVWWRDGSVRIVLEPIRL